MRRRRSRRSRSPRRRSSRARGADRGTGRQVADKGGQVFVVTHSTEIARSFAVDDLHLVATSPRGVTRSLRDELSERAKQGYERRLDGPVVQALFARVPVLVEGPERPGAASRVFWDAARRRQAGVGPLRAGDGLRQLRGRAAAAGDGAAAVRGRQAAWSRGPSLTRLRSSSGCAAERSLRRAGALPRRSRAPQPRGGAERDVLTGRAGRGHAGDRRNSRLRLGGAARRPAQPLPGGHHARAARAATRPPATSPSSCARCPRRPRGGSCARRWIRRAWRRSRSRARGRRGCSPRRSSHAEGVPRALRARR